jgi:hypothetical protein
LILIPVLGRMYLDNSHTLGYKEREQLLSN